MRISTTAASVLGAAGVLCLAQTASGIPSPDQESVWEQGTVVAVPDGDTIDANMTVASLPANLGHKRVRTIGVQAPEVGSPPQCGATESRDILRQQLPIGAAVQTRSISDTSSDDYSDGRIVRSLYAPDSEGNWFDISRWTVSNGWLLWFPLPPNSPTKPEWAHNLEYRVLADDAAAAHRGIWTPSICGPEQAPGANLRVWVAYTQSTTLDGIERVFVANNGVTDVPLGGWTIRDAALNMGAFPPDAVVHAGKVVELQLSATWASAYPGVEASYLSGGGPWFDNLPANNIYFHGDAGYLMDAPTSYATGNLRSWFPYPCNPDTCTDPLAGLIGITNAQNATPALGTPAAPGSVVATASTDGSGSVSVAWAAPFDFGGPVVTYTVSALDATDTVVATQPGVTGLSSNFTLPLDGPHTFRVVANNTAADSPAASTGSPVTATNLGGPPTTSTPGAQPPAVANPWSSGQFVDVQNISGGSVDLGGYGLWTQFSSSGSTDVPAYLFPAGLTLSPGVTLRVRVGNPVDGPASQPGLLEYLLTGQPGVGLTGAGDVDFLTPGQYVELANLNRAQVACFANGGVCRPGQQTQTISSPPVGITASTTTSSARVSWGGPISTGGLPITGYVATAYDAAVGGNPSGYCQTGAGLYSCDFPAAVGQKHYVEVVAMNALGASPPSQRVLAAPRTLPAAPSAVTVAGGPGSISVRWTPGSENGATVTHFTARAYSFGTGGAPDASCTATTPYCNLTGLAKDRTYFVDVTATNRVGEGPASSPRVQARTSSSGTAVSTYSSSKVTVRWVKQPGATRYEAAVYDAPANGKLLGSCHGSAKATKCTTKKVKKKSLYYIDLTFISPAGNHLVVPRSVTGPAKKPGPPTAVASHVASGTKVIVNWEEPGFNGYSLLKSYTGRVYSKASGGKSLSSCATSAKYSGCTTKSNKKLKRGMTYWVTAKVKNSKGWSSYAAPRVPVTIP